MCNSLSAQKKNNSGEAIVYARINVNKKRLDISLKKSIDPGLWDNAAECIKENKPDPSVGGRDRGRGQRARDQPRHRRRAQGTARRDGVALPPRTRALAGRPACFPCNTLRLPPRTDPAALHTRLRERGIQAVLTRGGDCQRLRIGFAPTARHGDSEIDHALASLRALMGRATHANGGKEGQAMAGPWSVAEGSGESEWRGFRGFRRFGRPYGRFGRFFGRRRWGSPWAFPAPPPVPDPGADAAEPSDSSEEFALEGELAPGKRRRSGVLASPRVSARLPRPLRSTPAVPEMAAEARIDAAATRRCRQRRR